MNEHPHLVIVQDSMEGVVVFENLGVRLDELERNLARREDE